MKKQARIEDIAREAGVGKGTVARVLHTRGYVSEEKRQIVLKTIE
ncbi:MAG: LacI family DNA-binding transcriptional regulator, partial [Lachnospiraceae bacterium]|nr:LacI family DNA-binding transcriptional regulator [Lachnospiraceae bacterium]